MIKIIKFRLRKFRQLIHKLTSGKNSINKKKKSKYPYSLKIINDPAISRHLPTPKKVKHRQSYLS